MRRALLASCLIVSGFLAQGSATVRYVSPAGTANSVGSSGQPWDLQTALNAAQPGDTVWLQDGAYLGNFVCRASGTTSNPIIFRQRPGHRARIQASSGVALTVQCKNAWFWGFEVFASSLNRVSTQTGSWPTDIARDYAISAGHNPGWAENCKFINLVVHDAASSIGLWRYATDAEIYGNIFYYSGWQAPDRSHGPEIYSQNFEPSVKRIEDNIVFRSFRHGLQIYSTQDLLRSFHVEGNVFFDHGELGTRGYQRNVLINGGGAPKNITFRNNHVYYSPRKPGGIGAEIGSGLGCSKVRIEGNHFIAQSGISLQKPSACVPEAFAGNVLFGAVRDFAESEYPQNTFHVLRPQGVRVFVRPNRYEEGRSHIVIYNWDGQSDVAVDVSQVLVPGESYEVRDVQNYFGQPVAQGTYQGQPLILPMHLTEVAKPVGNVPVQPTHTSAEFGVFVLIAGTGETSGVTISNVAASSIGSEGATITWTTNKLADSQVFYGPDSDSSLNQASPLSLVPVTSHSITLTQLSPDTVYRYRVHSRDADGRLATSFDQVFRTNAATSSGPPATAVYRINAGGANYTDSQGWLWSADFGFNTGVKTSMGSAMNGTVDDPLFRSERWDESNLPVLEYSLPVTNGTYRVNLYFAENYGPNYAVGKRVFDVQLEGQTILDNLDIFAEAGASTALVKTADVAVSDGAVNLRFLHGVENPKVNAIEVLALAGGPADQAPEAVISASTASGTAPLAVGFNANGSTDDGTIVTYGWNFGDGGTATGVTANHNYPAAGTYTATLTVTDNVGQSDTATATITVQGPADQAPEAVISASPASGTAPLTVGFNANGSTDDGTIVTYGWNFGDGGTATGLTANHTYTQAGTFTATLTVTDNADQSDTATAVVTVQAGSATTAVHRINAGAGNYTDSQGQLWSADFGFNTGTKTSMGSAINGTVDDLLFRSERWDPSALPVLEYSLPVTNGAYRVNLYFAENFSPNFAVGKRVFDVQLEGQTILDNLDIFAEAGASTALVKNADVVVSDGVVNIRFLHVVENPKINAIEVLALAGGPGDQTPEAVISASPASGTAPLAVDFNANGSTDDGTIVTYGWDFGDGGTGTGVTANHTYAAAGTFTVTLTVTDNGGQSDTATTTITVQAQNQAPTAVISAVPTSGTAPLEVGFDASGSTDDGTIVTYSWNFGDGGTATGVTANHTYAQAGTYTATLTVTDNSGQSSATTNIEVLGGTSGLLLYRVNAGGVNLSDPKLSWQADTSAAPSSFHNSGSSTSSTSSAVNLTHPSIPAGTPMALFQSERWDSTAAPEMLWQFPVNPGTYIVNLYFAEIYSGTKDPGDRVFDVKIEGDLKLDNYDVAAKVGYLKGIVETFLVTVQGSSLDIEFVHQVENPAIKGIEIMAPTQTNALLSSAGDLDFGDVSVGSTDSQTISLLNAGAAGDPSIVVASTEITGSTAFDDNFNDGSGITLAPGQFADLTITFDPSSGGTQTATLEILHSGNNSPTTITLTGRGVTIPIGFGKSQLVGPSLVYPTSLQFGPDGRLYVSTQAGLLYAYQVQRTNKNAYSVVSTENISHIQTIPNHNDDGSVNPDIDERLITGIYVAGTPQTPVLYVTSSDPRIAVGFDSNLDTNSGTLSRLTRNGSGWVHTVLVQGLPRSEENHGPNGMALDAANGFLYIAQGGNTNLGAPSSSFAVLPEYALSAAILRIDLNVIGNTTYNLPTLDDEDRPGVQDANDPFGGNNGKNQAKLVPGGPVQVYASGFRNPYDVVITEAGRMYSIDNGSNAGWGNVPVNEGPQGNCTNDKNEPGTTEPDGLHFITGPGFYGGHPNPTRGNAQNKFNSSNPQSPVQQSNPVECDHRAAGAPDGSLVVYKTSTNGLAEYTASNFGGGLKGDLLSVSHSKSLNRVELTADGAGVQLASQLDSNMGSRPLDVTVVGDNGPFPGTIWVADHAVGKIYVLEPNDYNGSSGSSCTGANNAQLDEDGDGFSNADEIANGTNPCSAADSPPDADGDFVSDLLDPDDDNDQLPDTSDPFAVDGANGRATNLPVVFTWDNDEAGRGGLLGLGFTGLMTNGSQDYLALFDPDELTAGGAAGVFTVDQLTQGDALGSLNTQENGFQFGINVSPSSPKFTLHTRVTAPFAGVTPEGNQSMGLFFGTGDQDNYVKLILSAANGPGAVQTGTEMGGAYQQAAQNPLVLPGPDSVDLYLEIDPSNTTAQASYEVRTGGVTAPRVNLGLPQTLNPLWFSGTLAPAVGLISTGRGGSSNVSATWEFFEVLITGTVLSDGRADISITPSTSINASTYNPGSLRIKNNSTAGSKITEVSFNLLGSFLEGIVFDPNGDAGDPVSKGFTPDSAGSTGLTGHSFFGPRDGGFDGLTATFNDFGPGKTFTFSVDIDPTSIHGAPAPGPNESGSVSGLELSGGTVTVAFSDGTEVTAEIFAQLGSVSGGVSTVMPGLRPEPTVEIVGFGPSPQTTNSAQQTVRITATPNATIRLLWAEGGAFTDGVPAGAPQLGQFEANSVVAVQQTTLVTNSNGIVEVPVTLAASSPNAGLNFFLATEINPDGSNGLVSAPFVVELAP